MKYLLLLFFGIMLVSCSNNSSKPGVVGGEAGEAEEAGEDERTFYTYDVECYALNVGGVRDSIRVTFLLGDNTGGTTRTQKKVLLVPVGDSLFVAREKAHTDDLVSLTETGGPYYGIEYVVHAARNDGQKLRLEMPRDAGKRFENFLP